MATIDFVIGGVLAISLFIGTWRGLVKEVISILAWVSSFIMSITFVSELNEILFKSLGTQFFSFPLSFFLLFIGTMLFFSLVSFPLSFFLLYRLTLCLLLSPAELNKHIRRCKEYISVGQSIV